MTSTVVSAVWRVSLVWDDNPHMEQKSLKKVLKKT